MKKFKTFVESISDSQRNKSHRALYGDGSPSTYVRHNKHGAELASDAKNGLSSAKTAAGKNAYKKAAEHIKHANEHGVKHWKDLNYSHGVANMHHDAYKAHMAAAQAHESGDSSATKKQAKADAMSHHTHEAHKYHDQWRDAMKKPPSQEPGGLEARTNKINRAANKFIVHHAKHSKLVKQKV